MQAARESREPSRRKLGILFAAAPVLVMLLTLSGCDLFQDEVMLHSVRYVELNPEFGTAPVDRNLYEPGANIVVRAYDQKEPAEGFLFIGWNTEPDFTGVCCRPGDIIPETMQNITLYAQWEQLHQIEYITDGIDEELLPGIPHDDRYYRVGEHFRIQRINYELADYGPGEENGSSEFISGWSVTPGTEAGSSFGGTEASAEVSKVYKPGDRVLITADMAAGGTVRIYPQFSRSYTVRYHAGPEEAEEAEAAGGSEAAGWLFPGDAAFEEGISVPSEHRGCTLETEITIRSMLITLDHDSLQMLQWSTAPDGKGAALHAGDRIRLSEYADYFDENGVLDLYPVWVRPFVVMFYFYAEDSGGYASGDGAAVAGTEEAEPSLMRYYLPGQTAYIPEVPHPHSEAFVLDTWNTQPDGSGVSVEPGEAFRVTAEGAELSGETVPSELRLFAQYEQRYAVIYSAAGSDGGTAPVDGNFYACGEIARLKTSIGDLSRSGYLFSGWNTSPDGSGISYQPGDTVVMADSDLSLYPQWAAIYRVHYHDEYVTAGELPRDDGAYVCDDAFTVLRRWPKEYDDRRLFIGWSSDAESGSAGGSAGGAVTHLPGERKLIRSGDPKDMHLYAVWRDGSRIIYDGSGADEGEVPEPSVLMLPGSAASVGTASADLSSAGKAFAVWNTKADGSGKSYNPGDEIILGSSDITLYAVYDMVLLGSAGGLVFYDKGFYADGWRYLEAAPKNWTDSADDPGRSCWDYDEAVFKDTGELYFYTSPNYEISGTCAYAGCGAGNTDRIVQSQNARGREQTAAQICDALVTENGGWLYDDWFLPSAEEIMLLDAYADSFSGYSLSGNTYWTSTEASGGHAYSILKYTDGFRVKKQYKSEVCGIIPIRKF